MRLKDIIPAFALALLYQTSSAQLQLSSGTQWVSSNSTYVVLDNTDLRCDAAILPFANIFKFTGNLNSEIKGTRNPTFNNMILQKTGTARLILQRDISLKAELKFDGGLLDLNGFALLMEPTASFNNESEKSRMMGADGYAKIIANLNAPATANPGNLGAVISSSQNLGSTTIYRGVKSQTNTSGGGNSILRYYDIVPTNNTGLDATLGIKYFDAELNGLAENALNVYKSLNSTDWIDIGYNSRDMSLNYVGKSGMNDFSLSTLSTMGNALPVNFTTFTAICRNGNAVLLAWSTAQEENSDFFEIQRSEDAIHFTTIAKITAAGNTNNEKNYSFTDNDPQGNIFYRIAETDKNGAYSFTQVRHLECGNAGNNFSVYPNPVAGKIVLAIQSIKAATIEIRIIDVSGKQVYFNKIEVLPGNIIKATDLHSLAKGVYTIIAEWNNKEFMKSKKIVKQ